MLCLYFFSTKKMATQNSGKRNSVFYKYDSVQCSIKEGVSLTLKELSMQLEDDVERRRMYALFTCIFTLAFNLFLGVAAFICAARTDSSAGYAFALDCFLDVVAASFVIWRFYGSFSSYSDFKENLTCVCLGILFILASVGIMAKSVHDLVYQNIPQQLIDVFIIAGVGGIVNFVLGFMKYNLGKKMMSQSLKLEAINTFLSALLSLMLAVSEILYFCHPAFWMVDPITSICVAIILFVGGVRVLCGRKESSETTPLLVGVAV